MKQVRVDLETLKTEILILRSVVAATQAQVSHRKLENKALVEAHVHASSEQLSKKEDELRRGRSVQRFNDAHARTHCRRLESEADLHQCEHEAWSRTPRWKSLNTDECVIWRLSTDDGHDTAQVLMQLQTLVSLGDKEQLAQFQQHRVEPAVPEVDVYTFNSRGVLEMLKKLVVKLTDKLRELESKRGMQPRTISCQYRI